MPTPASSECTHAFTDRHIHGLAGVDFATSSTPAIRNVLELLAVRRTTGVIASLPTIEVGLLSDALTRLAPLHAAGLLEGVHLEGPFLAPQFAGAHPSAALLTPDEPGGRQFLRTLNEHQTAHQMVTMMTIAPELPGFETTIQTLLNLGIEPALGHTAATYQQMRDGIDAVYARTQQPVTITHLYNAMRGFHHRDPGPLLAVQEAVAENKAIVELIADGYHVDLQLVAWWFAHWPEAIRLVSDASAATLPPGVDPLSSQTPRLGHIDLAYPGDTCPRLRGGDTLASGGKDLLAIHDDLLAAGFDHDLVCAAMR